MQMLHASSSDASQSLALSSINGTGAGDVLRTPAALTPSLAEGKGANLGSVVRMVGDGRGEGRGVEAGERDPQARGVGATVGGSDVLADAGPTAGRLRSPNPPSCRLTVVGGIVMLDSVGFGIRLSIRRRIDTLRLGSASTSSVPNRYTSARLMANCRFDRGICGNTMACRGPMKKSLNIFSRPCAK